MCATTFEHTEVSKGDLHSLPYNLLKTLDYTKESLYQKIWKESRDTKRPRINQYLTKIDTNKFYDKIDTLEVPFTVYQQLKNLSGTHI